MVPLSRIGIEVDTTDLRKADISLRALGNAINKLDRRKRQLEMPAFKTYAVAKLKRVVFTIAMNIASNFYMNTHQGDDERIAEGKKDTATAIDKKYFEMYQRRNRRYGIPMQAGYHAGAYSYSETKIPKLTKVVKTQAEMLEQVKRDFLNNYTLGDKFYITAKGPAYQFMQKGDIGDGDGIVRPTIEAVMRTYSTQIQAAYNKRGDYAYRYP